MSTKRIIYYMKTEQYFFIKMHIILLIAMVKRRAYKCLM